MIEQNELITNIGHENMKLSTWDSQKIMHFKLFY